MKNLKKLLVEKKFYIINIILLLSILLTIFIIKDIHPFGNNTLAIGDANSQFQPILYNYIEKIRNGTLENYSFNNALGSPTIFNYIYYLASPLNILCILFKNPNSMFIFTLILRLIITSITTTFYFNKKTNNNFITTICSISYTFSGWFLTYYFCNIWTDIFMIFPIFQYSLEKLINENKSKLYIFTLTYIMISNFYLAFMICVYTLIYYLFNIITKKEKYLYKIKNFQLIMFSTILVCLLCALHIYLIYISFIKMSILLNNEAIPYKIEPLQILSSIFYGQINLCLSPGNISFPNICLNMLITISTIYFFFNKNIILKERLKSLIAFIIITIAIFSKNADFIIHGFHIPIGLTYRYSFIISFYMIYLFIKNYKTFNNKIDKNIYLINSLLTILLIYLYKQNIVDTKVFILNLFTILAYTSIFIFYKKIKYHKYLIMTIILFETITVSIININTIEKKKIDYNFNKNIAYREIINAERDNDNNNLYYNKNTITTFTTMNYKKILSLLNKFGIYTDYTSSLYANHNTKTFNLFFNINHNEQQYLEKIFSVNNDILNYTFTSSSINNQQNLIKHSTNTNENPFKEVKYKTINKNTYTYLIKEDNYYIFEPNEYFIMTIKKDNQIINNDLSFTQNVLEILYLEKDTTITIETNKENTKPLLIYYEDNKIINKIYNILKDNQISYTNYSDSLIEGKINVEENQIIFTTIPYDESWKITIDGKETKPIKVLDNLIGIKCPKGTHKLKLEYKINYTIPLLISISTLIGIVIHSIIKKKKDTTY